MFFTDIFELEMTIYTSESLDNLYNKDLIPIVLSLQNKLEEANNFKTEFLDEIRKLKINLLNLYALQKM